MNKALLITAFENNYKYLMSTWNFDVQKVYDYLKNKYSNYTPDFESGALAFDSFIKKITPLNQGIKYNIYESQEIINELTNLSQEKKTVYHTIKENFTKGIDNSLYCSKMHLQEAYKDNLFCHHGVYHLHFAKQPNRTNDLLFLTIKNDNIYMITIKTHSYFYDINILDIINNNWPKLLEVYKIKEVITQIDPNCAQAEKDLIIEQNEIYNKLRDPKCLKKTLDNNMNPMILLNDNSLIMTPASISLIGLDVILTMGFKKRKIYIDDLTNELTTTLHIKQGYHPVYLAIFDIADYALHLFNMSAQHCFIFSISEHNTDNNSLLKKFPVLNQLHRTKVIDINSMQKLISQNPYKSGFSLVILNQINDDIKFNH